MAQRIKHRRGSVSSVSSISPFGEAEIIIGTGSVDNKVNGPIVYIGKPGGDDAEIDYTPVSKIYDGSGLPSVTTAQYGTTLDGLPYYDSTNRKLYILSASNDGTSAHSEIITTDVGMTGSISEMAAYDGDLTVMYVSEVNRGGFFTFNAALTQSDGGTSITATGNKSGRWERIISDGDAIKLNWWDLDVEDHTPAFRSLATYCNAKYNENTTDPKDSSNAYIPKYGSAYELTNTDPIIWFCNVNSDTDARINYVPDSTTTDGKYGICFQIGVDEMDMQDNIDNYTTASRSEYLTWVSATSIAPDTGSEAAGRIRIQLSSSGDIPPDLVLGDDYIQVRRSESPYNNASFEIESTDNNYVYGYYAKWTGTTGSRATSCVADTSSDIQVRFRRASLEDSAATMNGFTVHLPQIFNGLNSNSAEYDYPLFINRKNTAVVLKQMRSCNVTFNRIWYFQTAIRVLGSDSIKAIENNLGNVYNLGRFRDNGIHIDASPNMNIGGKGAEGAMVVGQVGPAKGGTCNNNIFIGGYINSTNYPLFSYPTGSNRNVESISVAAGVCTLTFVSGSVDMNTIQEGYILQLRNISNVNNGGFTITSVDSASYEVTYNNDSGEDVPTPTDDEQARVYISGVSGNHLLRAFSNTSRIVGRPDNNNFIGTIFEDRGAICENQFYLVGLRKTSFIGCRYETGDNIFPDDKNKPYMKFVAADGNVFQNGTGLDYRDVTYEENSAGNKFFTDSEYAVDVSDANSLRQITKGEMRVSGGRLTLVDSEITIPKMEANNVATSSLFVSGSSEKLVWKDNTGTIRELY
jgi:hypothetical protein